MKRTWFSCKGQLKQKIISTEENLHNQLFKTDFYYIFLNHCFRFFEISDFESFSIVGYKHNKKIDEDVLSKLRLFVIFGSEAENFRFIAPILQIRKL